MTAERWDTLEGTTLAVAGLVRGLGGFMVGQVVEAGRDVKSHMEHRRHLSQASIGHTALRAAAGELHTSPPDSISAVHQV